MTKYYCKYCDFRTIRENRLEEHYINFHNKKKVKYSEYRYKKYDLKLVNNFMNKTSGGHDKKTDLIKKIIKKYKIDTKIIYDIGANVGIVSLYMAKKFTKSQVYSFEPVKSTFDLFENNIKLNNLGNITAYNFGIYKENKDTKVYIPSNREIENIGLYSLKLDNNNGINPQDIKLKRLCDLNLPQPDFVKLDVEGCEYDIINDNKDIFKNCALIMTEEFSEVKKDFYNINKSKNIFELLDSLNFEIIDDGKYDKIFINRKFL